MLPIYKKELKNYFTTYTGYIFVVLISLCTGIYSWFVNFKNQSPDFEYVIYNLSFLFLISIPILTMKSFSEEYRQKTDRLLFSLPIKPIKIAFGKFFSSVTVLFFSCISMLIIPLVLCIFGNISLATCVSTVFGFFLLGCTLLSIGIFISSLCKNPIISAISTFLILFIIYLTPTVSTAFTTSDAVISFFSAMALFDRLLLFVSGIFDLTSVIYYLTVIIAFVLLTSLSIKSNVSQFKKIAATAVLLIITIAINVSLSFLPTRFTHIDTSDSKLFTISDWTKNELNSLDKKVEIFYLCSNKIEDENISELLLKYKEQTDKVTVKMIDTAINPYFYADYVESAPSDNSIIVSCEDKSFCIDYYEIYEYSDGTASFDGEGEITAAIKYVTSENTAVLYTLEGHEETVLADSLADDIRKENVDIRTLNLTALQAVPDDADCLLIYSPKRDISNDNKKVLSDYMTNGGKIIVLKDYTQTDLTVFDSFLAEFGLKIEKGIVQEQNSNLHYPGQPYTIIPVVLPHNITQPVIDSDLTVLFPFAGGITYTDNENSNITAEAFIATEETAFSTMNLSETTREKNDEDVSGPFALAMEVVKNSNDTPSTLILYSTSLFLSDSANELVGGANADLFINTVNHLCQSESLPSIRPKVLIGQSISVSQFASNISFIIFVIVLPLTLLLFGTYIIYKRKNR